MAIGKALSETLFLDSAYAIALASPGNKLHAVATELATAIKTRKARLLTTEGILLEIGDSLSKPRFRPAAIALLESMTSDPSVEVLPPSSELVRSGFDLFRQRSDKSWGLTDCVSFPVMQRRGVRQALTSDEHFEQAGFEALLRED